MIRLWSNDSGNQFYINPSGTQSIDYADIRDSYAITAATANNSYNRGNNTNWTINGGSCFISISGRVCSSYPCTGSNPSSVCDDATYNIAYLKNGSDIASTTCASTTGAYTISNLVVPSPGDIFTIFINGETQKANLIWSATDTAVSDLDFYENTIVVRHDDAGPVNITDLDYYDHTNDPDLLFTASSAAGTLTASSTSELFIWEGDTFQLDGQSAGTISLHDIRIEGILNASSTQTINISGTWLNNGTTSPASSSVVFNPTTQGYIKGSSTSTLYNLSTSGSGTTTIDTKIKLTNDLTIGSGTTLYGSGHIRVYGGDITGDGLINLPTGTILLDGTGSFGGSTDWTIENLIFGNGSGTETTSKTGSNNITITRQLTISTSHTLNASSSTWTFNGIYDKLYDISQVTGGDYHTCALKSDGSRVYCWGYNGYGQLGNNATSTGEDIPQEVVSTSGSGYLTDISQISAGGYHTCALKSDGSRVYCWGYNWYGQLGDNSTTSSDIPVEVVSTSGSGYLQDISQISAGGYHTCALRSDGTRVYCWGNNGYGQLGDNNSPTNSDIPVEVVSTSGTGNLTDISQVSAGDYHTCSVRSDGSRVYCWGDNFYGQLGDNNSSTDSDTPVEVAGLQNSSNTFKPFIEDGTLEEQTSLFDFASDYTFSATSSTQIEDTTYYNLKFSSSSETYVLEGNSTTTNYINIQAGTLDVTTNNYTLVIGGNWTNSGTFTARSGEVIFFNASATSTISGATDFYDFTCNTASKALLFATGTSATTTITGTFTINGGA
ncbi:MAG: hypothetical protein DRO40_13760, partial [Thermoprotei archaeon]